MIRRRVKYLKLVLLVLLGLIVSNALFAQVKERKLKTGFYKVVEKSIYKIMEAQSKEVLFLDTVPVCKAVDFRKAGLIFDERGMPMIEIQLGDKGTEKFAKATRDNIGKRLAIIADGELLSAPIIQSEITGGRMNISGSFIVEEARHIIAKIKKELPQQKPKTKEEEQKESEIRESCSALDSALMKGDIKSLKGLLHDKLSLGHSNGLIESKEEVLQHLQSGHLKYYSIEECEPSDIWLVGSVTSIRRQLKVLGALEGKGFETNLKVLEIWIMVDKKWKLLSRQAVKKVDG